MNEPVFVTEPIVMEEETLAKMLSETGCLPSPSLVNYYNFEADRRLFVDFEVGSELVEYQKLILKWNMEDKGKPVEERKPIWVYVFSPGGDLECMWAFIDTIMISKTPVYTVDIGYAASAASLIFLAGSKRIMLPRSKVLIHEGSASMSGDSTKVLDASDNYRKEIKRMREFILSRTSIPQSTLTRKHNNDWEIDAPSCLEYGICTEIAESLDDIF